MSVIKYTHFSHKEKKIFFISIFRGIMLLIPLASYYMLARHIDGAAATTIASILAVFSISTQLLKLNLHSSVMYEMNNSHDLRFIELIYRIKKPLGVWCIFQFLLISNILLFEFVVINNMIVILIPLVSLISVSFEYLRYTGRFVLYYFTQAPLNHIAIWLLWATENIDGHELSISVLNFDKFTILNYILLAFTAIFIVKIIYKILPFYLNIFLSWKEFIALSVLGVSNQIPELLFLSRLIPVANFFGNVLQSLLVKQFSEKFVNLKDYRSEMQSSLLFVVFLNLLTFSLFTIVVNILGLYEITWYIFLIVCIYSLSMLWMQEIFTITASLGELKLYFSYAISDSMIFFVLSIIIWYLNLLNPSSLLFCGAFSMLAGKFIAYRTAKSK